MKLKLDPVVKVMWAMAAVFAVAAPPALRFTMETGTENGYYTDVNNNGLYSLALKEFDAGNKIKAINAVRSVFNPVFPSEASSCLASDLNDSAFRKCAAEHVKPVRPLEDQLKQVDRDYSGLKYWLRMDGIIVVGVCGALLATRPLRKLAQAPVSQNAPIGMA